MARRILIIDDDAHIRESLQARLEFMGYDVSVARDGQTGLALLSLATAQDPIDGVLLDVHMPIMDGVAVLQEIVAKHPKVPVVMMSAGPDRRLLEEAVHLGARDSMMKPFDQTVLMRVCEQVFPLGKVEP